MTNQNNKAGGVAKRAQQYLKENDQLLRKHKLIVRLVINFAPKMKAPMFSRFALWVVGKQGGRLDIQFGDIRKE